MAQTTYRPASRQEVGATQRWVSGVLAALGFVAAAIGAWLVFGPDDGAIRVFGWTWSIAEVASWVAPTLLIGGGATMAAPLAIEAVMDGRAEHLGASTLETLLALVGVAAIVLGLFEVF